MNHPALISSIVIALSTGCTDTSQQGAAVTTGNAPQQLQHGSGKGDGPTSTDPRILNCQLEYESFAPTFASQLAGSFDDTFAKVVNDGLKAADDKFRLDVVTNPMPPFNLSFIAQLSDATTQEAIAYVVLPAPEVGDAFLFELGGKIPAVTLPVDGGGTQDFGFLRSYCSIRNP
jgi:hypothetical protein